MTGQFLKVEHLFAESPERLQDAALATAGGAANYLELELAGQLGQAVDDHLAVDFVAVLKLLRVPADTPENEGHRAAALSAAPADDQRAPGFWPVEKFLTQMACDVFGNVGGADFFRLERRYLLVKGANFNALLVVEHRAVDRSRDMVFGKLGWRADVDDFVEGREFVDLPDGGNALFHFRSAALLLVEGRYSSSGASPCQTLSSKRGCASAVGCRLSA